MKKEVNSIFGIVLIAMVSLLLIVGLVFIMNKNNFSKDKDNSGVVENKEENNNDEPKYEKISNVEEIGKQFYDKFISRNAILFLNYNKVFKDNNKFEINSLSFDDRMSIISGYLYDSMEDVYEDGALVGKEISNDKFKSYYLKLFGEDGYDTKNFKNVFYWCSYPQNFQYNSTTDKFIGKGPGGCGSGPYSEKYLYDKVEQNGDKIELYIKVGYITPSLEDYSKQILYKDYDRKNILSNQIEDFNIEEYKDQLNTLIYTLTKENEQYILESIKLVERDAK